MKSLDKIATKTDEEVTNGAAMAAVLAAAIGSFALGLIVLFNAMGLLAIPTLYEPAGGVSGRTTLAVVIWLIGWGILHYRWNDRHISYRRTLLLSFILIAGSIVFTFPPLWSIF
jgi:multisubunit Na+/H+ antiporter MnhG subunit